MNILIVDDTESSCRLLGDILSHHGYDASYVLSGEAAIGKVAQDKPHLILLDIDMPSLNGYEVCEVLKNNELTRDIPIILMSALDELSNRARAFKVGAIDYLTKPFHLKEVVFKVEQHIAAADYRALISP